MAGGYMGRILFVDLSKGELKDEVLDEKVLDSIQYNVLLYGAGTQSTGLLLMALEGEFESKPDFAVFADTGAEPDHVIEYKEYFAEYVKKNYDFDIITVSKGNLDQDIRSYLKGETKRVAQIPLRSYGGLLMRQCTQDYKIAPADKIIKQLCEVKRKNKEQVNMIGLWMGISLDEIQRMKSSTQWWKVLIYPLIEKGFRREDTINYVTRFGLKTPPRSACYFCPFHSPSYWNHLKKEYPNEHKKAIEFDELIRNYPKLKKQMFLHRQTKPLSEVENNQTDLFGMIDECEGYCGM